MASVTCAHTPTHTNVFHMCHLGLQRRNILEMGSDLSWHCGTMIMWGGWEMLGVIPSVSLWSPCSCHFIREFCIKIQLYVDQISFMSCTSATNSVKLICNIEILKKNISLLETIIPHQPIVWTPCMWQEFKLVKYWATSLRDL